MQLFSFFGIAGAQAAQLFRLADDRPHCGRNASAGWDYRGADNKTRMVFRSNSYKSTGFNEMTFEDATGGENMFFHAQKDHTTKIENNQTNSVGANYAQVINQNQALTVGQNQS